MAAEEQEVDLSNLAQHVIDFDRMSPESWCVQSTVVGFYFSLQKEHETALSLIYCHSLDDPSN